MTKDLEGGGCAVLKVLSRYSLVGAEENHEESFRESGNPVENEFVYEVWL